MIAVPGLGTKTRVGLCHELFFDLVAKHFICRRETIGPTPDHPPQKKLRRKFPFPVAVPIRG